MTLLDIDCGHVPLGLGGTCSPRGHLSFSGQFPHQSGSMHMHYWTVDDFHYPTPPKCPRCTHRNSLCHPLSTHMAAVQSLKMRTSWGCEITTGSCTTLSLFRHNLTADTQYGI